MKRLPLPPVVPLGYGTSNAGSNRPHSAPPLSINIYLALQPTAPLAILKWATRYEQADRRQPPNSGIQVLSLVEGR